MYCRCSWGPNVYVDTKEMAVVLYWYGSNARYELSRNAVDAIDEIAEELYNSIQGDRIK